MLFLFAFLLECNAFREHTQKQQKKMNGIATNGLDEELPLDNEDEREPQSQQSVPDEHAENSLPGPPSSHAPSMECVHESLHRQPVLGGDGLGGGGALE
jgi:hypothetical protein